MFDWGAQAVTSILNCGLYEALQKIQKRPWLYDGLDKWIEKLEVSSIIFYVVLKVMSIYYIVLIEIGFRKLFIIVLLCLWITVVSM